MDYDELDLIRAKFLYEDKTRFSCTITINGIQTKCYIATTCKLSKLFAVSETEALVTRNHYQRNLSDYSLFALKKGDDYLIVNSGFANNIVKKILDSQNLDTKAEYYVENYKCDFYIDENHHLIEVKSIISDKVAVCLPNIASKRIIRQFQQIYELLLKGYQISYYFVLFAPKAEKIIIDAQTEYGYWFNKCLDRGMKICLYRVNVNGDLQISISQKNCNMLFLK